MSDFVELEAELKKLRPAPVSDDLTLRIESALGQAAQTPTAGFLPGSPRRAKVWWSFALGLTTAAALLFFGLIFFAPEPRTAPLVEMNSNPAPEAKASGFQAAGLTQVVYAQHDEGLVFSPNEFDRPLRRMRYETRDTMQWRNARTGASLRVSYPTEQVVLTPVAFQ